MSDALERTLPRVCYFSPDWFAVERDKIFAREWGYVARAEALPERGSYIVVDVAGESILIVRGERGLGAFYNLCRHRGSQLVLGKQASCGQFGGAGIRCPYHSWTYTLDGALKSAPFLDEASGFTTADFPLHRVSVDTWGGFVFVNLDPTPRQTLAEQLGPIPERVRRYPLADLRSARTIVYDVTANWKVILENYNEYYHCAGVHPELCAVVPAFKYRGGSELDWDRGVPHAAGAWTFTASGTTNRRPFPELDADEQIRHKGELIYPNFMCSLAAEHVAAFRLEPLAPGRTRITFDCLFHPTAIAAADFDPSDAVDFWDLVNRQDWMICEGVQRGMAARPFQTGFYAPMESLSLDIRRYIHERLGPV
jgi:phenylpropionate dioxygenase-like ring-hydroxylating dioxygenase large terminal subunit